MISSALNFGPRIVQFKISRALGTKPPLPISLTVSVTNQCNSKCKTCSIWQQNTASESLGKNELTIEEFRKIFENYKSKIFWATLSGGEPFLRRDIVDIYEALCENCQPAVVNIPSNSLLSPNIERNIRRMLEKNFETNLTLNLSLDGISENHDDIRGVKGNFERFLDTFTRLKKLKSEFPQFQIGIHTVISKYNIAEALNVYEFAKDLRPDSYITEVAENRSELFNQSDDITPDVGAYGKFANALVRRIRRDYMHSEKRMPRLTQVFRLRYYQFAAQMLKENDK